MTPTRHHSPERITMNRTLATIAAATLGAAFTIAPAYANDHHDTPEQTGFVLAGWVKTTAADFPQSLVGHTPTSDLNLRDGDNPDVPALHLPCGQRIQLDVYRDDQATADLIAGGVLHGPGNPYESWKDGQYVSAYSLTFTSAGCVTPTPTPTQSVTPTPTPTVTETPTPTPTVTTPEPTPTPSETPTPTPTPTDTPTVTPTPTATPTPSATPSSTPTVTHTPHPSGTPTDTPTPRTRPVMLAQTGTNLGAGLGLAGALLAVGGFTVWAARRNGDHR